MKLCSGSEGVVQGRPREIHAVEVGFPYIDTSVTSRGLV